MYRILVGTLIAESYFYELIYAHRNIDDYIASQGIEAELKSDSDIETYFSSKEEAQRIVDRLKLSDKYEYVEIIDVKKSLENTMQENVVFLG